MKTAQGLKLRRIGRRYMIVAPLSLSGDSGCTDVFTLNESAAYLWDKVQGVDFTEDDLCSWLCEAYHIDRETASRDVSRMLSDWRELGLLEASDI